MGSIVLNGQNEIGLGYSVSGNTLYPGIRYCGQSAAAYATANGNLDISEEIIQTGVSCQTGYNRWGDYSAIQVDPTDNDAFWFTSEYIGTGGARKTKIASFIIGPVPLSANFRSDNLTPQINTTVNFTDFSQGGPINWSWSVTSSTFIFVGGTSSSSQNPKIEFTAAGDYTINSTIWDGANYSSEIKTNYISAVECDLALPFTEDFSEGELPQCWRNIDHVGYGQGWQFNNPGGKIINTTTAANGFAILDSDHYGPGNDPECRPSLT